MYAPRRMTAQLVVLAVVAVPLTACGGSDGEGLLPTPTRSITASPTRTPSLPTPTRTPSDRPTDTPTEPASETPTEPTPTPAPTKTPKPTETVTVTESPSEEPSPTDSASPTESPSPTETTDPDETSADEEEHPAPAWVWWLLGLALLALAIGIPLYLWSKRRRGWRNDLAAAEAELVWLARTHLPELRQKADSPDRVAGGWEVAGEGRASAAEDHLTVLEGSAPDDEAAARARTLRDAVRAARGRLSALQGTTDPAALTAMLDAAIADLEAALRTPAAR